MNDLNGSSGDLGSPNPNLSPETLDFSGPKLNPVPMPEKVAPLPDPDVWGFLQYIDPIDDPDMLAFQVAQLTVGMAELKRRLDEATWVDREFVRQLMKDIANERSE